MAVFWSVLMQPTAVNATTARVSAAPMRTERSTLHGNENSWGSDGDGVSRSKVGPLPGCGLLTRARDQQAYRGDPRSIHRTTTLRAGASLPFGSSRRRTRRERVVERSRRFRIRRRRAQRWSVGAARASAVATGARPRRRGARGCGIERLPSVFELGSRPPSPGSERGPRSFGASPDAIRVSRAPRRATTARAPSDRRSHRATAAASAASRSASVGGLAASKGSIQRTPSARRAVGRLATGEPSRSRRGRGRIAVRLGPPIRSPAVRIRPTRIERRLIEFEFRPRRAVSDGARSSIGTMTADQPGSTNAVRSGARRAAWQRRRRAPLSTVPRRRARLEGRTSRLCGPCRAASDAGQPHRACDRRRAPRPRGISGFRLTPRVVAQLVCNSARRR